MHAVRAQCHDHGMVPGKGKVDGLRRLVVVSHGKDMPSLARMLVEPERIVQCCRLVADLCPWDFALARRHTSVEPRHTCDNVGASGWWSLEGRDSLVGCGSLARRDATAMLPPGGGG